MQISVASQSFKITIVLCFYNQRLYFSYYLDKLAQCTRSRSQDCFCSTLQIPRPNTFRIHKLADCCVLFPHRSTKCRNITDVRRWCSINHGTLCHITYPIFQPSLVLKGPGYKAKINHTPYSIIYEPRYLINSQYKLTVDIHRRASGIVFKTLAIIIHVLLPAPPNRLCNLGASLRTKYMVINII